MSQPTPTTIVVLQGDQTGQELLVQALRVLDPDVVRLPLAFETYDISLEARRRSDNAVLSQAAAAMCRTGFGLKAATITPADADDVGSPNAILREAIDGQVILRTGRRLPNVRPVGGVHAPIAVVRMAVGDAYGAKVFGGPKFTVSPVYEGMFKQELDAAAARRPQVRYDPQLIDATYALLLQNAGEALVIPALNRDGDCLSDLVLQMYGSIAGSESIVLAFDETALQVRVVMAEAPHGTAPALEGKNLANPLGMILAGAALLTYLKDAAAGSASRAIYESAFEAIAQGIATHDLGGPATTTEFTDEVIRRVRTKLDIWSSLP
jgi:isocitrate dehydrogenase (NAD+)